MIPQLAISGVLQFTQSAGQTAETNQANRPREIDHNPRGTPGKTRGAAGKAARRKRGACRKNALRPSPLGGEVGASSSSIIQLREAHATYRLLGLVLLALARWLLSRGDANWP